MSNFIITIVTFIAMLAVATYLVMAWPFFLVVLGIWMSWKVSVYGWRLLQKNRYLQPNHMPNSL